MRLLKLTVIFFLLFGLSAVDDSRAEVADKLHPSQRREDSGESPIPARLQSSFSYVRQNASNFRSSISWEQSKTKDLRNDDAGWQDPYSTTEDPDSSTTEDPYTSISEDPYSSTTEDPYTSISEDPYSSTTEDPYTSISEDPYSTTDDSGIVTPSVPSGTADQQLEEFLAGKMLDYKNWVKDNLLDPTEPVREASILNMRNDDPFYIGVQLHCEIKNLILINHSNKSETVPIVAVNIEQRWLTMGQRVQSFPGWRNDVGFIGEYNCSGSYNLQQSLVFAGQGFFTSALWEYSEFEKLYKWEITEDYKIDLTDSIKSTEFNAFADSYNVWFSSEWDNEDAGYVGDSISYTFAILFNRHLQQFQPISQCLNPSIALLMKYVTETLENIDLSEVIDDDLLPPVRTTTTTPKPVAECPPNGLDKVEHPTNCSLYYLCANGEPFELECEEDLHFNSTTKKCELPELANCRKMKCPSEGTSYHPFPGNCSFYFVCVDGVATFKQCLSDTCFDPDQSRCLIITTTTSVPPSTSTSRRTTQSTTTVRTRPTRPSGADAVFLNRWMELEECDDVYGVTSSLCICLNLQK